MSIIKELINGEKSAEQVYEFWRECATHEQVARKCADALFDFLCEDDIASMANAVEYVLDVFQKRLAPVMKSTKSWKILCRFLLYSVPLGLSKNQLNLEEHPSFEESREWLHGQPGWNLLPGVFFYYCARSVDIDAPTWCAEYLGDKYFSFYIQGDNPNICVLADPFEKEWFQNHRANYDLKEWKLRQHIGSHKNFIASLLEDGALYHLQWLCHKTYKGKPVLNSEIIGEFHLPSLKSFSIPMWRFILRNTNDNTIQAMLNRSRFLGMTVPHFQLLKKYHPKTALNMINLASRCNIDFAKHLLETNAKISRTHYLELNVLQHALKDLDLEKSTPLIANFLQCMLGLAQDTTNEISAQQIVAYCLRNCHIFDYSKMCLLLCGLEKYFPQGYFIIFNTTDAKNNPKIQYIIYDMIDVVSSWQKSPGEILKIAKQAIVYSSHRVLDWALSQLSSDEKADLKFVATGFDNDVCELPDDFYSDRELLEIFDRHNLFTEDLLTEMRNRVVFWNSYYSQFRTLCENCPSFREWVSKNTEQIFLDCLNQDNWRLLRWLNSQGLCLDIDFRKHLLHFRKKKYNDDEPPGGVIGYLLSTDQIDSETVISYLECRMTMDSALSERFKLHKIPLQKFDQDQLSRLMYYAKPILFRNIKNAKTLLPYVPDSLLWHLLIGITKNRFHKNKLCVQEFANEINHRKIFAHWIYVAPNFILFLNPGEVDQELDTITLATPGAVLIAPGIQTLGLKYGDADLVYSSDSEDENEDMNNDLKSRIRSYAYRIAQTMPNMFGKSARSIVN